jgi:hypothetical protein
MFCTARFLISWKHTSKGQFQTLVAVRNKQKRMLNFSVNTLVAETLLGDDWTRLFQLI